MERKSPAKSGAAGKASQPQPPSTPAPPQVIPAPFLLPVRIAFYLCLISHVIAATSAPIQDCDETFNYWEPLHYISRGYGLQTWEYSPEFGIRSWAYIALHAMPAKIASVLFRSKTSEFYFVRVVLGTVCAATETKLYSAITRALNPRIGIFYLIIVAFAPGFFYASVAFLPSSFAMYTSSLGLAAFMDWRGGSKTASAIMWFGIGAMVGWPFSGFLILPFLLEEAVLGLMMGDPFGVFRRFLAGGVRCLLVLAVQVGVDTFFYHKPLVAPWRLVTYNVFGGSDSGPDIFGTEPWDFYIKNLLLNFNLWFVLALMAAPTLIVQALFLQQQTTKQTLLRTMVFLAPFYLWLGVFTLQPHKEERFMYPAYPFLALNASITLHMILSWVGTSDPKKLMGRVPTSIKLAVIIPIVAVMLNVGFLRLVGTVSAYDAPMKIYNSLTYPNVTQPGDFVCFGKDWYRFPTSYFLPNGARAKFIQSEFDGLLPGDFHEGQTGFGTFPGTWLTPPGMNKHNQADPGKLVDISHCKFLVDTWWPNSSPPPNEPFYAEDTETWQSISCVQFLDAAQTSLFARSIWVPNLPFLPDKYQRKWGEHCMLQRRSTLLPGMPGYEMQDQSMVGA